MRLCYSIYQKVFYSDQLQPLQLDATRRREFELIESRVPLQRGTHTLQTS